MRVVFIAKITVETDGEHPEVVEVKIHEMLQDLDLVVEVEGLSLSQEEETA